MILGVRQTSSLVIACGQEFDERTKQILLQRPRGFRGEIMSGLVSARRRWSTSNCQGS
jgi:hypothetical protein